MSEQETVLPGSEVALAAPEKGQEDNILAEHRALFEKVKAGIKPSETKKEAKKEPPKAAPAAAEEKPAEEPAKPKSSPRIQKIRTSLEAEGVSKKALDALDDDEVLEFWEREEVRNEASRSLHRELEESKKPKAPPPEPVKDTTLEDITAELSEQFGETEAAALAKVILSREQGYKGRIEALESMLNQARESGQKKIIQDNRDRLAERLPTLAENDKAWGHIERAVLAAFQENAKAYDSAEDAFDAIFEDLYGDVALHEEAKEEPKETEEAKNGEDLKSAIEASAPSLPGKSQSERRMSAFEKHRKVFNHLKKHPDDVAGAMKAGRIG